MKEKLCLALDGFHSMNDVRQRVRELHPYIGYFKIGSGAFSQWGPSVVDLIHDEGGKVFLDLKYHDIPNTVAEAASRAASMNVDIFNVHASGGFAMMKAAIDGSQGKCKVIAVTVLTSLDEVALQTEVGVACSLPDHVLHLATLAHKAGLHGIVSSAHELELLRPQLPNDFFYITPGISGATTHAGHDQKRVMTPGKAIHLGSSLLVIGRAINGLHSPDERIAETKAILDEVERAL